jgi:hypothetical protein
LPDRLAHVAILVPQLGRSGLPIRRYPALLDCLLLVVRIALTRRRNQASIDDLTRHGNVTRCLNTALNCSNNLFIAPIPGKIVRASGTRSSAADKCFLDMLFETNLRRERRLEEIAKAKTEGVYKGRKSSIDQAQVEMPGWN